MIDQSECFLGWGHCREQAARSPGPSGNFQPHTPERRGGAERDGEEEDGAKVLRTRQKGGGGEELGHFRKFENVLCVVIIFYMKFDLRIYRGRANIRTLATALQCRL